jgi:N6-adenosine-specific RNA methylase IME4
MEQLPAGRFSVIVADPPWPYATRSPKGKGRSAEASYDTMSIDDIKALSVRQWAAADAVLFLWVTKPIPPRGFEVTDAWGFEYKTNAFTWVKTIVEHEPALFAAAPRFHFGMGHWTRANPEQCLLATRGHPHWLNADVAELLLAPRREHSRKPDEIYGLIERLVGGPYLELFARNGTVRPGWTRWIGKCASPERRWKSDSYPDAERPS